MRRSLIAAAIAACAPRSPLAAWAAESEKPTPVLHVHPAASATSTPKALAPIIAKARLATAKFATSLEAARKAGYTVNVTRMIPDMGWHFLNPKITGFDAEQAADPRLRQARQGVAARRVRVGVHREADEGAVAGSDVRLLRRGLPLRRRDVRPGSR